MYEQNYASLMETVIIKIRPKLKRVVHFQVEL